MADTPQIFHVRWLRSGPQPLSGDDVRIDAEAGVIYGVVMCQEGVAKGHGAHIDSDFIENLVRYDKKNFSKTGLKCRFGHPNASSETMGTQLGVYHNFRKREKDSKMQAVADLHLLKSAAASPTHGDMRSWVLKMAAERPDFIMSSIVFKQSGYYQRKGNGNKKKMEMSPEGGFSNYDSELGPVYFEFDEDAGAAHYFTDLVEQGAATDSLFAATEFSPHLFVSRVEAWLSDNPDIVQFIQANPKKLFSIVEKMGIAIPQAPEIIQPQKDKFMLEFFKKKAFGQEIKPDTTASEDVLLALASAEKEVSDLNAKFAEQDKTILSLVDQLRKLSERVEKVEATPAASHTNGKTEEKETKALSLWEQMVEGATL